VHRGAPHRKGIAVFTHDTMAKLLVEDRHRDIRAHVTPRDRSTAANRWGRVRRLLG